MTKLNKISFFYLEKVLPNPQNYVVFCFNDLPFILETWIKFESLVSVDAVSFLTDFE